MNSNLNAVEHAPENAVRDTMDKPIAFAGPNMHHAACATIQAIDEVISYEMKSHFMGGSVYLISDDRQKPLTIPERAIVAAFAEHFKTRTLGLERGKPIHFPKIVSSPDADKDDMTEVGFASEARAYAFAAAVSHVFDLTADVIEAPGGDCWLVSVSSPHGIDGDQYEQLRGACSLVSKYSIEYDADNAAAIADSGNNAPLTRIESALGEILSRLNQNPATAPETPSAARDAFDPSQDDATPPKADKHTLPGSRKTKKRSA